MNFDDIEMLDIPDDTSSTHTESMDSPETPTTPKDKEYPSLSEWLNLEEDLKFQFDLKRYKETLAPPDPFQQAQFEYISSLFKVVEDLTSHDVQILPEDSLETEPLGVITSLKDISKNAKREEKISRINSAFNKILENYSRFLESVRDDLQDEDLDAYLDLQFLLEFIQANEFPIQERQKPELLVKWVNEYHPKPEDSFVDEVVYNTPEPYLHPQFWTSYMGTLLTRGMFSNAAQSIKSSKYQQLGEDSPLYHIITDFHVLVDSYTSMALKGQFAEWKRTACEMRDNFKSFKQSIEEEKHITIARQIHELLRAITGLPKTLAGFVEEWYELYAALSLFQVRDDNSVYDDYFEIARSEKGEVDQNDLEEAITHVALGKALRVVTDLDRYDPATAAYVSKLYELKGLFIPYYNAAFKDSLIEGHKTPKKNVSDYLLTRHAFECFEIHPLANVGIGLFLHPVITPTADLNWKNRKLVGDFLPHYKCYTNDDMEWALTVCAKLNLPDVAKKLYLQQGKLSMADGHLYEALNMFVNCYDDTGLSKESSLAMEKVHHIVWELLFQDALLNCLPAEDELLNNIISRRVDPSFEVHPVIRQCIAPYAVLVEYLNAIDDERAFKKNISRLFHLIRFKYMPRKFVPLLFAQLLPCFSLTQLTLPDLVVMIELLDSFELLLKEEPEETSKLYAFAVETADEVPSKHDWRRVLQAEKQAIPETVKALIKSLRKGIAVKIGQVYITQ